jgi:hypothetical protein
MLLIHKGNVDEAEPLCRETLKKQISIFGGKDSDEVWLTQIMMYLVYVLKENLDEAEALLHQQIKHLEETRGPYHCLTLAKKTDLGSLLTHSIINAASVSTLSYHSLPCLLWLS